MPSTRLRTVGASVEHETSGTTQLRAAVVLDLHAALAADGGPDQLLGFAARSARRHLGLDAVLELGGTSEPARAGSTPHAVQALDVDAPTPLRSASSLEEGGLAAASLRHGRLVTLDTSGAAVPAAWRASLARHGYAAAAGAARPLAGGGWLAVTLLAARPRDWTTDAPRMHVLVEETARCAEVLVRLRRVTRANEDLRASLASRATIDQALGVIMVQRRCGEREAFDVLRRASQARQLKVRDVAAAMLEELTGRQAAPPRPFRERSA